VTTDTVPTTTPAYELARTDDPRDAVSLRRVAGRGALASASVEIVGRALTLLLSLAVARTLGPKETGLLALAVIASGLLSMIGALPETAAVAAPRGREDSSWALAALLLRLLLSLSLGVLLAGWFVLGYPHSRYAEMAAAPRLLAVTAVLLLIPLCECLNTYPLVMLQRRLHLTALVRMQGVQYLLSSSAGLAAVFLGFGIVGVALAAVIGAACATIVLWVQSFKLLRPVRLCDRAQLLRLTVDAGRVAMGSVGGYVAMRIDNVLVATSLGATSAGFYGMAWNTSRLSLLVISRPASVVLLPALASIQDDAARVTRGIQESLMLTFTAVGVCSAVLAVSAPGLVQLVLGPKWLPIVPCLRLMALTAFISAFVPIASALLTSAGQAHVQLWPALLAIICFLLLMPPVATRYGLLGAACVDLLAATSVTIVIYVLARRFLPEVKWWSRRQAVPLLAAATGASVAWVAGHTVGSPTGRLVMEVCVFAGAYVGSLRFFGGRDALASLLDLARRILAPGKREQA
jgi:O-antigen/teichoic acid export membrane protein